MGFYGGGASRSYGRYGRYGRFGDVPEAQDAVAAAQAKVAAIQVQRKNQLSLISFTQTALNKCSDFSAVALFTAGASAAICVAEQQTALGQRQGQLAQIDLQLNTAKGELAAAQQALAAAKAQAAAMPTDIPADTYSSGVGSGVGYSSGASALSVGGGGGGGLMDTLTSPLVLGGAALVVGLGAFFMLKKPRA